MHAAAIVVGIHFFIVMAVALVFIEVEVRLAGVLAVDVAIAISPALRCLPYHPQIPPWFQSWAIGRPSGLMQGGNGQSSVRLNCQVAKDETL